MDRDLDELHRAIGRVVWQWAYVENAVASLVFDLCAIHSRAFYESDSVSDVFGAIYANLDLRANIAIAKDLAFNIRDKTDLYDRLKPVLDHIGNDLRNERNRFVHDRWCFTFGNKIARVKKGTHFRREPSTGELVKIQDPPTEYASIYEIDDIADQLTDYRLKIQGFQEEAQELYRNLYPLTESP